MQAIGAELADLGIDVDCAPVLDVPVPGAHDVIGDRALSDDPDTVSHLASAACEGLIDAGVVPVIKPSFLAMAGPVWIVTKNFRWSKPVRPSS